VSARRPQGAAYGLRAPWYLPEDQLIDGEDALRFGNKAWPGNKSAPCGRRHGGTAPTWIMMNLRCSTFSLAPG